MASNRFINSMLSGYLAMGDPQAEEIRIKLKHGEWEVEITCAESRVKQVVENVLSSLDNSKMLGPTVQAQLEEMRREVESLRIRSPPESRQDAERKPSIKGGMTCRVLIEKLWIEEYFESEKSLAEVHEELSRRGYNYDRTAVSHSLTDMVRENILTRIGTMRNYRYIQKRPPSDTPI